MEGDSTSDSDSLVSTDKILYITKPFLIRLTESRNLQDVVTLDLHIRDKSLGKIRTLQNLQLVPNVKFLNASYNFITRMDGIEALSNLIELNLAENAIEKIEMIDNLSMLEKLNLSGNRIKRIPKSIASLRSLTVLRLARNELEQYQDVALLGMIGKLRHLRIDDNPFIGDSRTCPFAIYSIHSLEYLNGHEVTIDDRHEAKVKFQHIDEEESDSYEGSITPVGRIADSSRSYISPIPAAINPATALPARDRALTALPLTPHKTAVASPEIASTPAPISTPGVPTATTPVADILKRSEILTEKYVNVEKENRLLKIELSESKTALAAANKMIAELLQTNAELSLQLEATSSNQLHQQHVHTLQEEKDILQQTILDIRSELASKEVELTSLVAAHKAVVSDLNSLRKSTLESENYQLEIAQLRTEIERLSMSNATAESDFKQQELRHIQMTQNLSERIESLQQQLQSTRDSSCDEVGNYRARCEQLEAAIALSNKETMQYQQEIRRYRQLALQGGIIKADETVHGSNSTASSNNSQERRLYATDQQFLELIGPRVPQRQYEYPPQAEGETEPEREVEAESFSTEESSYFGETMHYTVDPGAHAGLGPLSQLHQRESSCVGEAKEIASSLQDIRRIRSSAANPSQIQRQQSNNARIPAIEQQPQLSRQSLQSLSSVLASEIDPKVIKKLIELLQVTTQEEIIEIIRVNQESSAARSRLALCQEEYENLQRIIAEQKSEVAANSNKLRGLLEDIAANSEPAASSKRESSLSTGELERLQSEIMRAKGELQRAEQDLSITQQLLQSNKHNLTELSAVSERENRTFTALSQRLNALRAETAEAEIALQRAQQASKLEKDRQRAVQVTAGEQLRLLQADLQRVQQEFASKRRVMEELEQQKSEIELQLNSRQTDFLLQQRTHSQDLDELSRQLATARTELRALRTETDQSVTKKKLLEADISKYMDCVDVEKGKLQQLEARHKEEQAEAAKQRQEAERVIKSSREQLAEVTLQLASARAELQEHRRHVSDSSRAAESKQATLQRDAEEAKATLLTAVSSLRQLQTQIDVKRSELDALSDEQQRMERMVEVGQRKNREIELAVQRQQGTLNDLTAATERQQASVSSLKQSEEQQKQSLLALEAHLSEERKAEDSLLRKLRQLREEEAGLSESVHKMRRLLSELRTTISHAQDETEVAKSKCSNEQRVCDVLETDIGRLRSELALLKERTSEETQRVAISEANLFRLREEIKEGNNELHRKQRESEDLSKEIELYKIKEVELKICSEALSNEVVSTRVKCKESKKLLDDVKTDIRRSENELVALREEVSNAQRDRISWFTAIENLKSQATLCESIKQTQESEVSKLKEANRVESLKLEQLQASVSDYAERVNEAKKQLLQLQSEFEIANHKSSEARHRVQEEETHLRRMKDQLHQVEGQMGQVSAELQAERQRAVEEIGVYASAKQHIQAQLIATSTANRKLSEARPTPLLTNVIALGHKETSPSISETVVNRVGLARSPLTVSRSSLLAPKLFISKGQCVDRFDVVETGLSSAGASCTSEPAVVSAPIPTVSSTEADTHKPTMPGFKDLEIEVERLRQKSVSILNQR